MVTEPTRVTPNSSTINLVYSSRPQLIESYVVAPPLGKSDHNTAFLNITLPKGLNRKAIPTKTIWLYGRADISHCKTMMKNFPLAGENDSIDNYWENWSNKVLNTINTCVPLKLVPAKSSTPWINHNISKDINKRNSQFLTFKKTKSTDMLSKYKNLRNKIIQCIKIAKSAFFTELAENH